VSKLHILGFLMDLTEFLNVHDYSSTPESIADITSFEEQTAKFCTWFSPNSQCSAASR